MQLPIIIIGAAILIVFVVLLIVFAPSSRDRGYRDNREKDSYELERVIDEENERAKGERRYRY